MRHVVKRTYPIAMLLAMLFIFFFSAVGGGADYARAATTAPSNVLDDLRQDSSFNLADYPIKPDDYGLYVKHIAESTDGELLIYVYQPCAFEHDLRASSINIAREQDNSLNLNFENYKLTFLNSAGVFYKYKVDDFEILSDPVRNYNISNILRPHEYLLDGTLSGDNKESEVPNHVGQFWTVTTAANDEVSYSFIDSEVITITKKFVGYIDLYGGLGFSLSGWSREDTFRNFVAFSTDRQIDDLIQVELQYNLQSVYYHICTGVCSDHGKGDTFGHKYGAQIKQDPVTISADDKASSNKHGIGGHSYAWDKIQTTAEFMADLQDKRYILTDSAADISSTQWVLNFYEAPWRMTQDNVFDYHFDVNGEKVSDVIILRLMFETAGKRFNLGVVDNKQTGSDKPINKTVGGNCSNISWGSSCGSSAIPWWGWLIIVIVAPFALFAIFKLLFMLITSKTKKRKGKRKNTSNKSRSKSKPRQKSGKKAGKKK